jgi:hypothetical protein
VIEHRVTLDNRAWPRNFETAYPRP